MNTPPIVFILSWERPLYLWACLDSLHTSTRVPCRFVLMDNASQDPLVERIIGAFEARGMFHKVYRRTDNSPHALAEALDAHRNEVGDYFGFVESDVMVLRSEPCWLEEFQQLTAADPSIAMLGSLIDKVDFIDPAWIAQRFPHLDEAELKFFAKATTKERTLLDRYPERTTNVITPPGRLMFLQREAIGRTGMLPDFKLANTLREMGYKASIATRVRHRHLSLANVFDYPEYERDNRDQFFARLVREKR
ncbi:MAG TPA: glycosyltransferase family A protein [Gammaproteobacteria bacterium]|jgi:hypothetical protein|nr:glycosyltransferase family A protein [Gammaproteobacteria bacterium]